MEKNFTHYYFLISCPGDVQDDVKTIIQVFANVNKNIGEPNHIHLVTLFWKDDAVPAAGNSAQEIINRQLLQKADGVIALFWTRFGTPTDKYGSGTEEEIARAINDKKDVLLYCSDKPIVPNMMNDEQYQKVVNFKNRFHGLFAPYCSRAELKTKLTNALTALIFKYAQVQIPDTDSAVNNEAGSVQYSLAEFFDLGWYLGRAKLEEPDEKENSSIRRVQFTSRVSMLLALGEKLNLLTKEELQMISSYRDKMMELGFKKYVISYGTENFERIHELFSACTYGLQKRLKNNEVSAFQLGMHYGRYAMIIELEWITDDGTDKVFVRGIQHIFKKAKSEYQRMLKSACNIDTKICESLETLKLENNLDLPILTYHEKMCDLAEEIMGELQLY